jgi:hypothetical protein
MSKVSELKGDSYLPEGMSRGVALKMAGEMRQILNRDLEESDIALEVTLYEVTMTNEEKLAAWGYLDAGERRAWKNFLDYETFLENERRRHGY